MKFWQFVSVCTSLKLLSYIKNLDKKWQIYIDWSKNFDRLVDLQDRKKLDYELPDELCIEVFSHSQELLFLHNGYLRSRAFNESDKTISIIEAFNKYGGEVIEDVFEFGLVKLGDNTR